MGWTLLESRSSPTAWTENKRIGASWGMKRGWGMERDRGMNRGRGRDRSRGRDDRGRDARGKRYTSN